MFAASITELAAALRAKRYSCGELTQALLDRIARVNPVLNAFITVDPERALADAKAADAAIAAGQARPLTGIPIAHKDILATQGMRTTCGSRMLANYVSPFDAHVVVVRLAVVVADAEECVVVADAERAVERVVVQSVLLGELGHERGRGRCGGFARHHIRGGSRPERFEEICEEMTR